MHKKIYPISLALVLASCSSTPPSQPAHNVRIMAVALAAEAPFVQIELRGPETLVQEATANDQGQATFHFPNLMAGSYTITARAYNSRPQAGDPDSGVVLYKTVVKNHVFDGAPLNLGLRRLTSTLQVEAQGVDSTVKFLSAKVGNKQVALGSTPPTGSGKLLGVETGVNRDVIVEGRATPGGPVVQQGTARITLGEQGNTVQVQLDTVAGQPPEVPVLLGNSTVKRGEVYALRIDSSDPRTDLKELRVDWGDGQIDTFSLAGRTDSRTLTHTFTSPGNRTVTAVVTNQQDLVRSASRTVGVTDTSTGTVVVGMEEKLTELTLNVTGVPETTTELVATLTDPNFQPMAGVGKQEFQAQYSVNLVPVGAGRWTATLGLPQDVDYTYQLMAGRIAGGTGTFQTRQESQTLDLGFQQGPNTAPTVKTFQLSQSGGTAPLSVNFTVQGDDIEGDGLTCLLDTDGNGTTDFTLENCQTPQTQAFTYTGSGRFTPILKVVDSKGAVTQGARVVKTGRTPWVSAYYTGWNAGGSAQDENPRPQDIDYAGITHIMVASIWANHSGSGQNLRYDGINTSFFQGPFGEDWARATAAEAHKNGDKALLMLGGMGFREGLVVGMLPENRQRFVQDLLDVIDRLGYDGIDLDWEPVWQGHDPVLGIEVNDAQAILQMAADLRALRPELLITLPVGWLNINFDQPAPWIVEGAALFDQINVMSYDMGNAWDGWVTWHASPLFGEGGNHPTSVASTTQRYLNSGVPANKFGIGIGFYGNCYQGNFGPLETPVRQHNGDNEMSYRRIQTLYGNHTVNVHRWDDIAKSPFLTSLPLGPGKHLNDGRPTANMQPCDFVSFENRQSILEKGKYVRDQGLGGTIIWTVNQGYFRSPLDGDHNPLLTATREAFLQ